MAGSAIALSGARARSKPRPKAIKYESVRKSQLRSKGLKPQKGVSYLPESDRKVNRWNERRLKSRTKAPRPSGAIRIRMGSGMMVAGRLIPYLAVGFIAYEMLPDSQKEVHDNYTIRDSIENNLAFGAAVYTRASLGYALGSNLLGAVFS